MVGLGFFVIVKFLIRSLRLEPGSHPILFPLLRLFSFLSIHVSFCLSEMVTVLLDLGFREMKSRGLERLGCFILPGEEE